MWVCTNTAFPNTKFMNAMTIIIVHSRLRFLVISAAKVRQNRDMAIPLGEMCAKCAPTASRTHDAVGDSMVDVGCVLFQFVGGDHDVYAFRRVVELITVYE